MLRFFAKILGIKTRTTSRPRQLRQCLRASIGLEELTPRILPSAGGVGLAGGHFGHHGAAAIVSTSSSSSTSTTDNCGGSQSSSASQSGDACHAGATLFANLSDSNGATGQATYNATTSALKVSVTGATVSTSLTVAVNGTSVGSVATDSSGNGSVTLSNVSVSSGDTITVGDLTGTFSQVKYTAALTGATGVLGAAEFNALKSRLYVSITGAAANTTYDVIVDSSFLGQLTTNSSGAGKVWLALTNPTIQTGSTISIADAVGNPAILQGVFG
jgi:hypothetical protein